LPSEVKTALQREAFTYGRTLNAEISLRLKASLKAQSAHSPPDGTDVKKPQTDIQMHAVNEAHPTSSPFVQQPLSDHDRAMLALFRQLPPEKQLSLLTLLR